MAEPVRVHREVLDRQYGHWCRDCRLPSGLLVAVAYTSNRDARVIVAVLPFCDDCHGNNVDVDPAVTWEPLGSDADDAPADQQDDEGDD